MTDDEISKLEILLAVAREKGALLSADEIEELTGLVPAKSDFGSIRKQISSLDSRYDLRKGFLIEKNGITGQANVDAVEDSDKRRVRAERYIGFAGEFSIFSGQKWLRVLSVAGSASYNAASENDDVDIFCITEQDSLWIYLTKALILARVFRMIHPKSPRFCFSYILDEQYALKLFSAPKDALFARDALTVKILQGSSFYDSLLQRGRWITDYFPKLPRTGKARQVDPEKASRVSRPAGRKALNHFLFLTVGNYVKTKSILLNRKLRGLGAHGSSFAVQSNRDHCIFESQSYRNLRRIYSQFRSSSTEQL